MNSGDGVVSRGPISFPLFDKMRGLFHKTSDMGGKSSTQSWGGRYVDIINSSELLNPANEGQSTMSKTAGKVVRFFARAALLMLTPVAAAGGAFKHGVYAVGHLLNALGDLAAGVDEGEFEKASASLLSCAKDVAHVAIFVATKWWVVLAYAALPENQEEALRRNYRNAE